MKVLIDLCAGLGGMSEAFMSDPEWLVIRIDNNPDLKPFVPGLNVADITDIDATLVLVDAILRIHGVPSYKIEKLVVWASPPCVEFSLAYNAPGPTAARNGEEFHPDMTIMKACHRLIELWSPDHWWIENVRGAIPHFKPILGNWQQQVGSFFLWGDHPKIAFKDTQTRYLKKVDKRHAQMRAQLRAKVPLEISQAIKDSIDRQLSLTSYGVGVEPGA